MRVVFLPMDISGPLPVRLVVFRHEAERDTAIGSYAPLFDATNE